MNRRVAQAVESAIAACRRAQVPFDGTRAEYNAVRAAEIRARLTMIDAVREEAEGR